MSNDMSNDAVGGTAGGYDNDATGMSAAMGSTGPGIGANEGNVDMDVTGMVATMIGSPPAMGFVASEPDPLTTGVLSSVPEPSPTPSPTSVMGAFLGAYSVGLAVAVYDLLNAAPAVAAMTTAAVIGYEVGKNPSGFVSAGIDNAQEIAGISGFMDGG